MKAGKPAPSLTGGATLLRLALQALTAIVVVGIAAFALASLWHLHPTATVAAAPPSAPSPTPAMSARAAVAKPSSDGYRKVEIAQISYGQADEQVGMNVQKESQPRGPSSIAVAQDGTLLVADDANARVQSYSGQGKHLGSIRVDEAIHDLAAGNGADLFVLSSSGTVAAYDRGSGAARGRWALDGALARALGTLRVVSGTVTMEAPRQVTYTLATVSGASLDSLSAADQARGARKGGSAPSKGYYSTSYRDGGHVYRQDELGNITQDIALGLPNALSVVYLDEDQSGSFYVQVESRADDGKVAVEVWRFDKLGTPTAVIPLEPVTYIAMVRSVVVAVDGTVYEAVPTKDSMRLVKWVTP